MKPFATCRLFLAALLVAVPLFSHAQTGSVGIGTTTPRGKLDVDGGGDTYLVDNPNSGTSQSVFMPGHLYLAPYSGTSGTAFVQGRVPNPTAATNIGLTLRTTNAGTLTDALTLTAAGRVGIGTGAPTQPLEVAGQVFSNSGGFRFPDNTVQTTASGKFAISFSLPSPFNITFNHGLNSSDVFVTLVDTSTGNVLPLDTSSSGILRSLRILDANTITMAIYAAGSYRVVVLR